MPNDRQVKQRINTAKNIAKITKAMEMVSASKMKRAQAAALSARPYAKALEHSLRLVASQATNYNHPLLSEHSEGKPALLIVSSDRGLCGSLNQNLFKLAGTWVTEHPQGQIITVGKKALAFAQFIGLDVLAVFSNIPDKVTTSDLIPLSTLIVEKFTNHELKSVDLLYTDFINTLSQKSRVTPLLPIKQLPQEDATLSKLEQPKEFVFEPNPADILNELLPYYLENTVFQSFLESKASEHSARMVAMKNASDNAKDLVKELQLLFNKSRQESITNELLDISTAAISLQA